jgi:ribosomal protein L34E
MVGNCADLASFPEKRALFFARVKQTMKREEKLKLASAMICCHCRKKHRQKALCSSCGELLRYVSARLNECRLPQETSSCFLCPAYCYNSDMRTRIKPVMRSAAPYMLIRSPILMVKYLHHLKKLHRSL